MPKTSSFNISGPTKYEQSGSSGGFFGQPNDPLSDPVAQLARDLSAYEYFNKGNYAPGWNIQGYLDSHQPMANYFGSLINKGGSLTDKIMSNAGLGAGRASAGSSGSRGGGLKNVSKENATISTRPKKTGAIPQTSITSTSSSSSNRSNDEYAQVRKAAITAALRYLRERNPHLMGSL